MSAEIGIGISVGAATPTGESGIGTAVAVPMESITPSFTPSFSISQSGELSTPKPSIAETRPLIATGESFSPDTAKSKAAFALTDVIWSRGDAQLKDTTVPVKTHDILQEQPTIRDFRISEFVTTWKNPALETTVISPKDVSATPLKGEPTMPVKIAEPVKSVAEKITTPAYTRELPGLSESINVTKTQIKNSEPFAKPTTENTTTVMQSLAEQYIDTHIVPFMTEIPAVKTIDPEQVSEARVDIVKRDHAVAMADADFKQAVKVREALLAIGVDEATATDRTLASFDKVAHDTGYKEELTRRIRQKSVVQLANASDETVEVTQYVDKYANAERYKSAITATVVAFQERVSEENDELIVNGSEIISQAQLSNQRDEVKSEPLRNSEHSDGSLAGFVETLSDLELTPENFEELIDEAIEENNAVTFNPQWSKRATDEEVEKVFNEEDVSPVYLHTDESETIAEA